ncbi:MAG: hypothetical protein RL685_352, partial [Pseudomonadota bacterium]
AEYVESVARLKQRERETLPLLRALLVELGLLELEERDLGAASSAEASTSSAAHQTTAR